MTPVVSVVGYSGSGKTTLIEKLIPELKQRGYRVGVVKHAAHGFDIDRPGKDSWRHHQAGADTVVVAGTDQLALVKRSPVAGLESLIPLFEDVDLVITEGYKKETRPKIEVFRPEVHEKPVCLDRPDLIALVSDVAIPTQVPRFGLGDIRKLADFIESQFLKTERKAP